ncbi:MAG TPA: amidohydrolase family protein, partial [Blastocatellia bacterium]|nr:amidohydrolase family protein [Blastocatellia bacterium]
MLITNATLVTWATPNQILEKHALYLAGDRIVELGPSAELEAKHPQAEKFDARGQLVMPGNICAHTHFYGAFARGMAIPGAAPKDFPEILDRLWWRLDKALTLEDVRYSALVCLIDAIKHGTTTLIDHHASPNAIDGSLDVVAEAVTQAGLRACLCYEVTDRDGAEKAQAGIKENLRFINSVRSTQNSTLSATFGLHASLTLSDATLEACRNVWSSGFHIHAAEHESDQYDSLQKSGLRVIDRLHKFGILGNRSIVAHAVHIDAREAALLAETGTWVTHQPRSNMNNAVGTADVESLLRLGVKVALGNDGFSNAMWDEWKAAYLSHKAAHRDPRRMNGATVAEMAITNNA